MNTEDHLTRLLAELRQPTLLLDEARARANIARMAERMAHAGVRLRPHFKTHVSAAIGEWFREAGIDAITVASVEMARYFADAGWRDITIAFPLNPRQLDAIDDLAGQIDLGVLVDNDTAASRLLAGRGPALRVWLKVDAGYGRAGVRYDDPAGAARLVELLAGHERVSFAGLLSHAGDSYAAAGPEEIRAVHRRTVERLRGLRDALLGTTLDRCAISIGDTPGCTLADDFTGVDEARPGNFVFHDLMQLELGVCTDQQIAVAVACPVVGKYPARGQLVVYGGAIHFSKDRLRGPDGTSIYGYLTRPAENHFGPADRRGRLTSLSQEHGVLTVEPAIFDELEVGDVALILPVHSCLTAHQFAGYRTLDGRFLARPPAGRQAD